MPALNQLVSISNDGRLYSDVVHFVHVYTIEAHPQGAVSPYSGKLWESTYSTKGQPKDYAGRVANAQAMEQQLQGSQLLLVDDLTPGPMNNPVWCTYGTCPNCSFLIAQNGTVVEAITKTPANLPALEASLKALLP